MNAPMLENILPEGSVTRSCWESQLRPALRARWLELLGQPSFAPENFDPQETRLISELEGPEYRAQWWEQSTGPDSRQKVVLLLPPHSPAEKLLPAAVVPCYRPEQVAGLIYDPDRKLLTWDADPPSPATQVRQWGAHLARQGFAVACVEAFPFNMVPEPPAGGDGFAWWRAAAAQLLAENPHWTGLGKLVHDTSRGLDLLLEQPKVDPQRITMAGHSLGGKRALYTAALDDRVRCAIGSDFGLPWRSTNWEAPWYLADRVPADECGLAHHQLLALLAPRPFFLIAGETDTALSFAYLEAARPVYALYDRPDALAGFNHATGHAPTPEALDRAYQWLRTQLQMPPRHWRHT